MEATEIDSRAGIPANPGTYVVGKFVSGEYGKPWTGRD